MIKESDLIGIPLTDKSGKKIACVIGILYSKKNDQLSGVTVSTGKLFRRNQIINFKDILSIENKGVVIKDKLSSRGLKGLGISKIYKSSFIGQEILNSEKKSLGYIRDIMIDRDSGKIIAFILTDGLIDDISKGRGVIPFDNKMIFSEENILVNNYVEEDFTRNREEYKKLLELL